MVRLLGACLCLCVRVCAYCVNVVVVSVCELLRDVVGFLFRECCAMFVRVFCNKCVDACVCVFCLYFFRVICVWFVFVCVAFVRVC